MRRLKLFDLFIPRCNSFVFAIASAALIACTDGNGPAGSPTDPTPATPVPPAPPPPPMYPVNSLGVIAGFVIDELNGSCIMDARIELLNGEQAGAVSWQSVCGFWDYGDDLGYSFRNLPYREYTLRASADGYESADIKATPSNPYQYTTMIKLKKK